MNLDLVQMPRVDVDCEKEDGLSATDSAELPMSFTLERDYSIGYLLSLSFVEGGTSSCLTRELALT